MFNRTCGIISHNDWNNLYNKSSPSLGREPLKGSLSKSIKFQWNICCKRVLSEGRNFHYEEIFSPVERYTWIKTMLSLEAKMKWKLHQMDVKTTFLNGVIEEEVYIEQPHGFETHSIERHMYAY